jgi:hypothetical protein
VACDVDSWINATQLAAQVRVDTGSGTGADHHGHAPAAQNHYCQTCSHTQYRSSDGFHYFFLLSNCMAGVD